MTKHIAIFYGTRPEAIKVAPVIIALKNDGRFKLTVIHTGQHKDLTLEVEKVFGFDPDEVWTIMLQDQTPNQVLAQVIARTDEWISKNAVDVIIAQGDTTTVLGVALASFNRQIKFAHLEAGLRTFNLREPFPEEANRLLTSRISEIHFCPTELSAENLRNEGITDGVHVVGNTIMDAVRLLTERDDNRSEQIGKKVLITAHRRENHGEGILNICNALKHITQKYPELTFTWPVHPNPNVHGIVHRELTGIKNLTLTAPIGHFDLLKEIKSSHILFTDSGGIQEEAAFFKKPVLILRNITERPEIVQSGFGRCIGTDTDKLIREFDLLMNEGEYQKRTSGTNPFGDGFSSEKIIALLNGLI